MEQKYYFTTWEMIKVNIQGVHFRTLLLLCQFLKRIQRENPQNYGTFSKSEAFGAKIFIKIPTFKRNDKLGE